MSAPQPPHVLASPAARDGAIDELSVLLRRAALGDETAFARIYQVASPRLYGVILRILHEASHAEEVTREAFLTIWATSAQYDPARCSAMSWMLTIAHRGAVDHVRSAEAATSRDDTRFVEQESSSSIDVTADTAPPSIDAARGRAALRTLPPRQRTAILLAYFAGQTHRQVATILGVPPSIANSEIREGLHSLANALVTPATPA